MKRVLYLSRYYKRVDMRNSFGVGVGVGVVKRKL